jgi:hypothetical protein
MFLKFILFLWPLFLTKNDSTIFFLLNIPFFVDSNVVGTPISFGIKENKSDRTEINSPGKTTYYKEFKEFLEPLFGLRMVPTSLSCNLGINMLIYW